MPGLKIELAQLMEDLIGDLTAVPQPIEIKLFSDNPDELQSAARKIVAAIDKVPGWSTRATASAPPVMPWKSASIGSKPRSKG